MKTALIQLENSSDTKSNFKKMLAAARKACERGAQILCFQELCLSLYFCQREEARFFDLAMPADNAYVKRLCELAAAENAVIVFPFFEKRAEGLFHNSALVIDADGSVAGLYRKMHIPHDPFFYEKYYFSPGDRGYPVFNTRHGRIGVLICWDQWFPEAARITALNGADIIFYPTAIGALTDEDSVFARDQLDAWLTIQRSHAIANGVFVAAVNRAGREGKIDFWGSSFVSDPFGRIIARAGRDSDEVLIADCDPKLAAETRRTWPFLRDRRAESYSPIERMFSDD